jgi:predicted methyltransferase
MEYLVQEIIAAVRKKSELSGLADKAIEDALEKYLRKNNLRKENLNNFSKSDIKLIVKDLRSHLRLSVGQYRHSFSEQRSLLEEDKNLELLKTHSSTLERADFYPKLKKLIKELKIKSILDLGCGLNPIALASLVEKYSALDINESDINLVNNFFKKNNINGKAWVYDLRNIKENDIPSADLCLLLKMFDVLEKKGHKLAEKIILNVKCKYFLMSFSTKTLSGRAMNHPQRGWIERLLQRLSFHFKVLKSKNEIFYLAWKNFNRDK